MEKTLEIGENAGEELQTAASVDTDTTFEPTIDELMDELNDDEATLREEEEIAALENDNPLDEIATLKEESEMPLEELLAKYNSLPPAGPPRKKIKKSAKKAKALKPVDTNTVEDTTALNEEQQRIDEITETTPQEELEIEQIKENDEELQEESIASEVTSSVENLNKEHTEAAIKTPEKLKIRRSHLFELYPEENFNSTAIAAAKDQGAQIFSEDEDIEEEEETDPDYVKKTIMVGSAFQAVIPGISQYGDIFPYENEDKLIWEPSQVSEAEVEEYLLKIREIKANPTDEDPANTTTTDDKNEPKKAVELLNCSKPNVETTQDKLNQNVLIKPQNSTTDTDNSGVVKDNEQALHLLVQCGYDFKEALRRKGLNAVPLTGGTMSIWSEEECQKFEEGIQKFGKDFFKIRQHQVRTRTMRELVLFYYLWKKSERRDHNFANADTVDHMDIYLNEDYGSNSSSNIVAASSTLPTGRKINGCTQNNFSIMLGNQTSGNASGSGNNHPTSPTKIRKRTASGSGATNTMHNSGTNLPQTK